MKTATITVKNPANKAAIEGVLMAWNNSQDDSCAKISKTICTPERHEISITIRANEAISEQKVALANFIRQTLINFMPGMSVSHTPATLAISA